MNAARSEMFMNIKHSLSNASQLKLIAIVTFWLLRGQERLLTLKCLCLFKHLHTYLNCYFDYKYLGTK